MQEVKLEVLNKQPYDCKAQIVHVVILTCNLHNPVQSTTIFIEPQTNAMMFYFVTGDNIY